MTNPINKQLEETAWDFSDIHKEVGETMLFGNEHECPDCGRGDIGDIPTKVKYTWIYDLMLKAFSKRLDFVEKNNKQAQLDLLKTIESDVIGEDFKQGYIESWTDASGKKHSVNKVIPIAIELNGLKRKQRKKLQLLRDKLKGEDLK